MWVLLLVSVVAVHALLLMLPLSKWLGWPAPIETNLVSDSLGRTAWCRLDSRPLWLFHVFYD